MYLKLNLLMYILMSLCWSTAIFEFWNVLFASKQCYFIVLILCNNKMIYIIIPCLVFGYVSACPNMYSKFGIMVYFWYVLGGVIFLWLCLPVNIYVWYMLWAPIFFVSIVCTMVVMFASKHILLIYIVANNFCSLSY